MLLSLKEIDAEVGWKTAPDPSSMGKYAHIALAFVRKAENGCLAHSKVVAALWSLHKESPHHLDSRQPEQLLRYYQQRDPPLPLALQGYCPGTKGQYT